MAFFLLDNTLHEGIKVIPAEKSDWNERLKNKTIQVEKEKYERNNYLKFSSQIIRISAHLNSLIQDEKFIKANIHLFGGQQYKHNTRDNFLEVSGWKDEELKVKTGNLIGFIKTKVEENEVQLKISSRFGNQFLLKLISYSDGFLEIPENGSVSEKGFSEWIAIILWKSALKKAFRLGLPKQYVNKSEELIKIRGNIDINDFIKRQGREGKYLCHYREHDYDNQVNRLISYTFDRIGKKNESLVQDCFRIGNAFYSGTNGHLPTLSEALATNKLTNPFYADYNRVIALSKNILRSHFGDISSSDNNTSAFLFDVSMLFEFFIRKVLVRNGFDLFPKDDRSFAISRGIGKEKDFQLYPDIIIKNKDDSIDVFDVKYKHFNFNLGVKREDLFQMHTYVGNILNNYKVTRCGFIYPLSSEDWNKINHKNGKIKNIIEIKRKKVKFFIYFFKIPTAQDLAQYNLDFNSSINDFANLIIGKKN